MSSINDINNLLLEHNKGNKSFYLGLLNKFSFKRWLLGLKGFQEEERISKTKFQLVWAKDLSMKEHVIFGKIWILFFSPKHCIYRRCGGKVCWSQTMKGPLASCWELDFSCGQRLRHKQLCLKRNSGGLHHAEGILEGSKWRKGIKL